MVCTHICDLKNIPHSLTHCLSHLLFTHSPTRVPTHSLTAFLAHISIIIRLHVCCALYCLTCSAFNSITIFFYDSTKQWWHIDALWCLTVTCIMLCCFVCTGRSYTCLNHHNWNSDYRAWDNNALNGKYVFITQKHLYTSLTHCLTTHSFTLPHNHSLPLSLNHVHPPTHSLPHSPTHSVTQCHWLESL